MSGPTKMVTTSVSIAKILPSFDGVCMALMSSKIDEIFLCCSVCFSNQFLFDDKLIFINCAEN